MRVPRSPSLPRARGQFIRRRFGVGAFAPEPALGLLYGPLVIGDADFHRFDLGAERRDLGALAVGDQRSFAELAEQFGQLRLLVGELPLGLAQRARLDLEFLFGRAQLIAQTLVAGFEREDRGGLVAELLLELIDGVAFLAKLGELRRGLGFHLLDAHFEASGRHREFGAELILVGADLGDRQRSGRFEPLHRQADGAVMHQRNEQQAKQRRNEESDAEIHDRFDHDATPPSPLRFFTQLARHARERERKTMPWGCYPHHIDEPLT